MSKIFFSEIVRDLYILQYRDHETKFFEGIWSIPEGVTYNSYILDIDEGLIIFDTWKRSLGEIYVNELKKHFDIKRVRYIVTHHMEPDHSGSTPDLLKANPDATIISNQLSKDMFESFYNMKPNFKIVRDGETIRIGGEVLRFIHTPWLHWPETMMTYLENRSILITCDVFGSYGVFNGTFLDEIDEENKKIFMREVIKYFSTVIGHYREWVNKNLEKIFREIHEISYILPSHGPAYRGDDVKKIIDIYKMLGRGEKKPGKTVIIYASMYGFLKEMISLLEEFLEKKGLKPVIYGFTDTYHPPISEIITDVYDAENIIIATSTYEDYISPLIRHVVEMIIQKTPRDKKVLLIISYGWSRKALSLFRELFISHGFIDIEFIEYRTGQHHNIKVDLENKLSKFFNI